MNGNFEDSTRSEKFSEKFMSHVCRKKTVAMILWCVVAATVVVGGGWLLVVVCCWLFWLVDCCCWLPLTQGAPENPLTTTGARGFIPWAKNARR